MHGEDVALVVGIALAAGGLAALFGFGWLVAGGVLLIAVAVIAGWS